ncbi:MAG: hypothetical protein WCR58_05890 [Bacteroidales bacterium]|nr:hypothetical protein [Bacteroidales bacterium]MDD3701543.1 hypothetical protein [Bacteroidales bacterium]MDY0369271.1 hypothetical protein [Bacteroidales bacterium]
MNKLTILISIVWLCCTSCSANHSSGMEYVKLLEDRSLELSENTEPIQQRIYQSFVNSIISKNTSLLDTVYKELENMYAKNQSNIIVYWKAYLLYYKSIYYIQLSDKDNSELSINAGIKLLGELKRKNSDDYALLALLQGFSTQFQSGIIAGKISSQREKNVKRALELDPSNIRAYYVYANGDFYTPIQYGGGKKAEEYLLKALALEEKPIINPFIPTWGREESYVLLIQLYIQEEKWDSAKKVFSEGIKQFPDSFSIQRFAQTLINH